VKEKIKYLMMAEVSGLVPQSRRIKDACMTNSSKVLNFGRVLVSPFAVRGIKYSIGV